MRRYVLNKKYLGLGSNVGNRQNNLQMALKDLRAICEIIEISPVFETPALVTKETQTSWDQSYLNMVVQFESQLEALDFLKHLKNIEISLGRKSVQKWAPRTIDIDILFWDHMEVHSDALTLPHPEVYHRSFVLDPLASLDLRYLKEARSHPLHTPLWMAIVNLTPDSFSNSDTCLKNSDVLDKINGFIDLGVHIIDIGAESTRPGAEHIELEEEWSRLFPILNFWKSHFPKENLHPLLSVDTYKSKIAERSIEFGADIINDVSGLKDPNMLPLLKNSDAKYVLTHSLDVPANPQNILAEPAIENLCHWLEDKLELFEKNGISTERLFFDPGIGFGKSAFQSIEILKNIQVFQKYPVRLLIGHSRKSFLKSLTQESPQNRDAETLGISLELIRQGVDVLRIHNPEIHIRAHRTIQYVKNESH